MYDLILRNGTVVSSFGTAKTDVLIKDGLIFGLISDSSDLEAQRIIDVQGCYVLPGGVDPHVHSNFPLGEFSTLDTFEESTKAAAVGGTTTIVDFAIPVNNLSPLEAFQKKVQEAANQVKIDFSLHAGLTHVDEIILADIPKLSKLGATTFKIFTVYRDTVMLSYDEIWQALTSIAEVSGLALIHAESNHIIEGNIKKYVQKGLKTAAYHPLSRPSIAEVDAVQTVLNMLRNNKCPAYFVHVSSPKALEIISKARAEGLSVWAETGPHYLVLDDQLYAGEHGERYICSPPLRSRQEADELWRQTINGDISIIGSDHCCYNSQQKAKYLNDFTKAPNGLPGIETRMLIMFSEGVMKGRLSLEQFVALTSTNPAKLNGLYPRKGEIRIGSDADITVFNPNVTGVIKAQNLIMKTDYSPFEGLEVRGNITTVIARGDVIVEDGVFVGDNHKGVFIPASKPGL